MLQNTIGNRIRDRDRGTFSHEKQMETEVEAEVELEMNTQWRQRDRDGMVQSRSWIRRWSIKLSRRQSRGLRQCQSQRQSWRRNRRWK